MATPAIIAIQNQNNSLLAARIEYSGNPEYTLEILNEFYSNPDIAQKVVSIGHICELYHEQNLSRLIKEKGVGKPQRLTLDTLQSQVYRGCVDYGYLYYPDLNQWEEIN